jgi:hypothetical protein
VAVRLYDGTADPDFEVESREVIAGMIPSLTYLLNDWDKRLRKRIVELIGNLAHHGEQ